MSERKKHTVFVSGAISPEFIGASIAKHSSKTAIGAHDIFLGQVRSDVIEGKTVSGIEYSAYEEMANAEFEGLREAIFAKYPISCMHIYHSLGLVKSGEICLFVFVSAPHRKEAFEACRELVEQIKAQIPIFGKEIFEDESHVWKKNV